MRGRPRLYWLAFKTQLIRAAPHNLRPNFKDISAGIDGLDAARCDVDGLRSRGVTRFLDLSRLNRRNIDDIDGNEGGMDDDGPRNDDDDGFPVEPPPTRRRLSESAEGDRPGLDLPGERSGLDSQPSALDIAGPPAIPEVEILYTSPRSRLSRAPSLAYSPTTMAGPNTPRIETDEEEPNVEPPHPGTVPNTPGRDPRAVQIDLLPHQDPHQPGHLKHYFQYDGNLIHHYQEQHQLLRGNLLVMDLNLILQWHHSMSLLVQQIDFDFSANDLINKRLRSLDPFDVVEINSNDPMTKMILDLPLVQLRAMCKPSTSPELKVNIYLMDGTVVMMEFSISLKTQWTSG